MKAKIKPKACLLPFGYPGYPPEYLERFTNESAEMLKKVGVDVSVAPIVINFEDSKKAAATIRSDTFHFLIPLVLSWLEAPNVIETIRDYFDMPMLLWSHTTFMENGKKLTLGPIPGVGVVRQTFEDLNLNFKYIYGMPEEEKIQKQAALYAKAAKARYLLRHSKIGLLGYPSMGMYTAMMDPLLLREKIGPEIDQLDQYMIIKRIEEMEDSAVADIIQDAKKNWIISDKVTDKDLLVTLKMYAAIKSVVEDYKWDAVTVKCQYELSKVYHHTPCVPLSMIGNDVTASCEADLPLISTQLMMHYLTAGEIVTYTDCHTVEDGFTILGACGYAPFGLAKGRPEVDKTEVLYEGLANCAIYKNGPITMARLNNGRNGKFKMQIETGTAEDPPQFNEVGCLPYPSMGVRFDGDSDFFAQNMMSQHYSVLYGNCLQELLETYRLMDIEPVSSLL